MEQTFKLSIEMVPQPLWGINLRSLLPRSVWDTIRKKAYSDYGHRCACCGAGGMMHCHEIWRYEEDWQKGEGVQHLDGFVALCPTCHHIKHIGHAGILAQQGKLDMNALIEHFCTVNECSSDDFNEHNVEMVAKWATRNYLNWRVDIGQWQSYLNGKEVYVHSSQSKGQMSYNNKRR
jgi:hypothetical protein